MYDLVIHGGTIATDYGIFPGSIVVKGGKVVQILAEEEPIPEAKEGISAAGKVVFPGFIDAHVHAWEPGQTHRDDFESVTISALKGGITTILEHPLSVPPVKDLETFELKLKLAEQKAYSDFGLWGALVPDNLDEIAGLKEQGCVAFKGFISYANENYPHLPDSVLYKAMEKLQEIDAIATVHAENADMAEQGGQHMQKLGRKDPLAHLESRETIVELEAIKRALLFAEATGVRLHIAHMSIHEGAQAIKEAKQRGVKVTVETCPHFIAADSNLLKKQGPFAKCTPPLRRPENTEKMWDYIFDGTIDFIASDHSAYAYEEKAPGLGDIFKAEPGMPGIATMVSTIADAAINKRGLHLEEFVKLLSTNIAKIFGLYPRKGTILPGSDADFTIMDLNKKWIIDGKKLYKCGWSPFDGQEVVGFVETAVVRGVVVYNNGEILGEKGYGKYIRPA